MADEETLPRSDYAALLREELEGRLGEAADGNSGARYTEQVFTEWCAELLEENGFITGFESSPWEFAPPAHETVLKISGHQLDPDGAAAAVFVTSWEAAGQDMTPTPRSRIERLVSVGAEFLRRALLTDPPLYRSLEPADPHAAFAESLWTHRDELRQLTLHVIINGLAPGVTLDDRLMGDIPLKIQVWDAQRIMRLHEGRVDGHDEISVDLGEGIPCVSCPATDPRYDAYLSVIPGKKLAEIYDRHGPRILEENVRAFLQLSVGVNKGIRKTLVEEPGAFFAYNNGLSATASSVETVPVQGALHIRKIAGLQIVNGAQTMGSIHRAWRKGEASLDGVQVPLKLTRVNPDAREEMVARISQYANSQTAVKLDDFSANRPFHVRLEELSRRIWAPPRGECRWYYERTRGQYQDELQRLPTPAETRKFRQENPPGQRLTKTDVARYVHAWERKPHLVALGTQKNFLKFSSEWLKDGWLPDDAWYRDLIARAIIFGTVRSIVRQADVPAYSANVVAYIVALLADRYGPRLDPRKVWDAQSLSPATRSCLQSWSRPVYDCLVQTAGGRNVTEWCKKPDCWELVRGIALEPMPEGIPEIGVAGTGDTGEDGRIHGGQNTLPIAIDFSADREKLLRIARDVVAGRTIKREDAIRELQKRIGLKRLPSDKRAELESLLDDLTHLAFIDDADTVRTDEGLAIVRKLVRGGIRDRGSLLTETAREWLGKQRVGGRIREQLDELTRTARQRRIIIIDGEDISCPTPQFDSYDDEFLGETVLRVIQRSGRLYPRQAVSEATVSSLGFTYAREEMLERIDRCIEVKLAAGLLECPAVGWLRRNRMERA